MELLCGHIRIEEYAGGGSFGEVYRGYDERMERDVAVKIINQIDKKECDVLRKLDHKGLPRLYDVVVRESKTFLIMEWIEGIDLERYIQKNGAVSERMAIGIGEEILDILGYLHSRKPAIVYQDLKPSNIMLMPDGHIKLVDFGTAVYMNYGDDSIQLAGTVGYSAPEQRGLAHKRHASEASDIYSWGAVMYTLTSGRLLNKPPYTMEKIRRVCPNISFGTSQVISRATKRNESERYRNISEIRKALQSGVYIDALMRCLFLALLLLFISPFILCWFVGMRGELFLHIKECVTNGWIQRSFNSVTMLSDIDIKRIGQIVASVGWMFLGIRLIQKRKYLKINKSVYLSEKKHSGIWLGAMLAGMILSYGLWGKEVTLESYAASGEILPISFCDDLGNHYLVNYGYSYAPQGELKICISEDVLGTIDNPEITVILTDKTTGMVKSRTVDIE